jgi:SAM-dependent methyltransferase/GNAT superfamily N-acetyltransferase
VTIHCSAFPNTLLSAIGPACVMAYYKHNMLAVHAVATIAAECEKEVIGYSIIIVGSGFQTFIFEQWKLVAFAILSRPLVLCRFALWATAAAFMRGLGRRALLMAPKLDQAAAGSEQLRLLSIAVDPHWQGRGVGAALLSAAEDLGQKLGYRCISLTVKPDNSRAILLYERHEWSRVDRKGVWAGAMQKLLIPSEALTRRSTNDIETGDPDVTRIRHDYAQRGRALRRDQYSISAAGNLFRRAQLVRHCVGALKRAGVFPLEERCVLDVGCGAGSWLPEFLTWGAFPEQVCGVDIIATRVLNAKRILPTAALCIADARHLPLPDGHYDLVTQFTMFTSLREASVKARIAREMIRVLKPGGVILWYDLFRNNPRNPHVQGIGERELGMLFDGCRITSERVTLAPPIGRIVASTSWIAALVLEKIPLLRTHILATIQRDE